MASLDMDKGARNELIVDYAISGATSTEVKILLNINFGIDLRQFLQCHGLLSVRQIQRIMKAKGVHSRKSEDSLIKVMPIITEELAGHGSLLGYRAMWNRLKTTYNLSTRRNTVMRCLRLLDPLGSEQRAKKRLKRRVYRSKGPNFTWHCDGYDKLKPFGIAVHGCIDGFSRKILWLEAASSNNNPEYIAYYFVNCVKINKGCPRLLRTDLGTENSSIAVIQPVLRHSHIDSFSGEKSHQYGKSTANQRIEALWSQVRHRFTEWWISFFKDLQVEGFIDVGISHHIDSLRLLFGPLINKGLAQFTSEWNKHRIRYSRMAEVPHGVPNMLYAFPELHDCEDYKYSVNPTLLDEIERSYCHKPSLVDSSFFNLAEAVLKNHDLSVTSIDYKDALQKFFILTETLNDILND